MALPQLVTFPISNADVINTIAYFHSIAEFPHVGAFDCSYNKLSNPGDEDYLILMKYREDNVENILIDDFSGDDDDEDHIYPECVASCEAPW